MLEITDVQVANLFLTELLSSKEFTKTGLRMLITILRKGLSAQEADDFDELDGEDLFLAEVLFLLLYLSLACSLSLMLSLSLSTHTLFFSLWGALSGSLSLSLSISPALFPAFLALALPLSLLRGHPSQVMITWLTSTTE